MTDQQIIQAFGGQAALARLLDIKSPAISYWKRKGIPKLRVIQLRSLRPDLFNEANIQTAASTPTGD